MGCINCTQTLIQKIEMVQRRAARYVKIDTEIPMLFNLIDSGVVLDCIDS